MYLHAFNFTSTKLLIHSQKAFRVFNHKKINAQTCSTYWSISTNATFHWIFFCFKCEITAFYSPHSFLMQSTINTQFCHHGWVILKKCSTILCTCLRLLCKVIKRTRKTIQNNISSSRPERH